MPETDGLTDRRTDRHSDSECRASIRCVGKNGLVFLLCYLSTDFDTFGILEWRDFYPLIACSLICTILGLLTGGVNKNETFSHTTRECFFPESEWI